MNSSGPRIRCNVGTLYMLIAACCLLLTALTPAFSEENTAEEYKFEASEMEKKPYHIGGYIEVMPILFGLDKNSSPYKLNFYNRSVGETTPEYDGTLQLEGSLEKGISRFYIKTNTAYTNNYATETTKTIVFEGNVSLKPSPTFITEFGKKTLNWGKGYAWTPAAFLDRPKNSDDPELAREGYILASLDYTRSWEGRAIKTFSFTPVLMPVYDGLNDDFGDTGHLNAAAKFYFLLYDTDIDFIILTGGSKTTRYGADFSRNITTNFEIHGELGFITDYKKKFIDSNGNNFEKEYDAKSYLIGIRYLTEKDTTYIVEYYRNGTGLTSGEMSGYFSFIDKAYNSYISSGSDALLKKALTVTAGSYGMPNPMTDYLYLRASQKEPFDILYLTPAITWIFNADDQSFSLSPELVYTGITNLELRLRSTVLSGERLSEYGEKQNDYRIELRVRYYF